MADSELIANTEIKKEKGFIYFIKADDNGNLSLYKTKAGRKKKSEKEPVKDIKESE